MKNNNASGYALRRVVLITAAASIAIAFALLWSLANLPQPQLHLVCQKIDDAKTAPLSTNVVPDFRMSKFHPVLRANFHVTSTNQASILVMETGVQMQTDSGWESFSQEPRNEVWQLKPGITNEMFVARPQAGSEQIQRIYGRDMTQTWRAYILYRTELKGPLLWQMQVRDLWKNWSFANWNRTRFGGTNEFFSQEFTQIGQY